MGGGDVAGQGEDETDRELGDGQRVGIRGVDDLHVTSDGRTDVDRVEAGACPCDHLQSVSPGDHVARDSRCRSNDQRFVVTDDLAQLVLRQTRANIDVEVLAQGVDPFLGDRIADEDAAPPVGDCAHVRLLPPPMTTT